MKTLLSLLCLPVLAFAADSKPNILFIVGDDMGYADVGFHGCKDIPTPNLDALAASGMRLTNGYVSGPYCSPTRAGLLTGRYQQRFGHEFNPGGSNGMPVTEKTIANRLKDAGYATGIVGKWHLGDQPAMQPQQRGFDEFFGFLGGAHPYFKKEGILRGTEPVTELDYTTDAFGREAAAFIDRNKAKPWFLYLAFNAVHTPMDATEDRLAKLADTGLDQNTLVTFISDNGGPTMKGVTVNGSRNEPLRGSKRTTLEGGVRVPFIVSWPGHVKPGVYDQPAIQLDLHATALTAAGVNADIDGVNLVPFINGEQSGVPHDALFWRFGDQMAVRSGDFKLVRYDSNADTQTGTRQPVTSLKLYNLKADLHEDTDLSAAQPAKVAELQAKWDAWNASNVAPLWGAGAKEGADAGTTKKRKKAKK